MDKPTTQGNVNVRRWVRLILLTGLFLAVQSGYMRMDEMTLPDQCAILEAPHASHESAEARVPSLRYSEHGTCGFADGAQR